MAIQGGVLTDANIGEGEVDRREASGLDTGGAPALEPEVESQDPEFNQVMAELEQVAQGQPVGEPEVEEVPSVAQLLGLEDPVESQAPAANDAAAAQFALTQQLMQQSNAQMQAFQQMLQQNQQMMLALAQRIAQPQAQQPQDPLSPFLQQIPDENSRRLMGGIAGALRQEMQGFQKQMQQMLGQVQQGIGQTTRQQQLDMELSHITPELQPAMRNLVNVINGANPNMTPQQVVQQAKLMAAEQDNIQRALIAKRRAERPKVPQVVKSQGPSLPTARGGNYTPKTLNQAVAYARQVAKIAQRNSGN